MSYDTSPPLESHTPIRQLPFPASPYEAQLDSDQLTGIALLASNMLLPSDSSTTPPPPRKRPNHGEPRIACLFCLEHKVACSPVGDGHTC
ncbi:hypothetical protein C0991_006189, partial [Blastosporella zonata]